MCVYKGGKISSVVLEEQLNLKRFMKEPDLEEDTFSNNNENTSQMS